MRTTTENSRTTSTRTGRAATSPGRAATSTSKRASSARPRATGTQGRGRAAAEGLEVPASGPELDPVALVAPVRTGRAVASLDDVLQTAEVQLKLAWLHRAALDHLRAAAMGELSERKPRLAAVLEAPLEARSRSDEEPAAPEPDGEKAPDGGK